MGLISQLIQSIFDRDEKWERLESFPDPPEPVDEEEGPHPMDHFTDQGLEPTMAPDAPDDADDGDDDGEDGEGEDGDNGDDE